MSVITATEEAFHEHPMLIIGGLAVGVLAIFYLKNRGGGGAQPANFTFSYGPSDAAIKAGTDLAIAQAGNNAALAKANLDATTQTTIAQDYFGYLTGANNNATDVAQAQNRTAQLKNNYDFQSKEYADNLTFQANEYANNLAFQAGNATSITSLKQLAV